MSLLKSLKGNAKVEELGYGLHENCVIISASNEPRKKKDGSVINRTCYITVAQLNASGKVKKNKTFSWFNVDATSEMAYDNFFTLLDQTTELMDILYPPKGDNGDEGSKWDTAFLELLEELEIEPTEADLRKVISKTKTCKPFMKDLGDLFAKFINKKSGTDSKTFRLKMVIDKSLQFIQLPRYDRFVELSEVALKDTQLEFNESEVEFIKKSEKALKAATEASNIGDL